MGFKEEADLDAAIKTTDAAIRRARNKELGIEEEEKVSIEGSYIFCRFSCFASIIQRSKRFLAEMKWPRRTRLTRLRCDALRTKIGTPYLSPGRYSRRGTFRTGSKREEEAETAQGKS